MVEEDHTQDGINSLQCYARPSGALQIPSYVIDRVTSFIMSRLTHPDVSKVTAAKVRHAVRSLRMEAYLTYVNVIAEQVQSQWTGALPVAYSKPFSPRSAA